MKLSKLIGTLAAGPALAMALSASAAPEVGAPAPGFTGTTSNGEQVSLSDFADQTVILEWTNHDCPFVVKHYETDNMQAIQRDMTADGVVWLTVISSAPGKQGHVSPEQANELTVSRNAAPTHVILDESGDIGRAYDAKTTPHMFIIEPGEAPVAYMGAIDSIRSARQSDVPKAVNYVRQARAQMAAGETVDPAETTPYGCSVKY
jgi:peroxiredoxin